MNDYKTNNLNKTRALALLFFVAVFGVVSFFKSFSVAAILVVALGIPFEIFILVTKARNKGKNE